MRNVDRQTSAPANFERFFDGRHQLDVIQPRTHRVYANADAEPSPACGRGLGEGTAPALAV